MSAYVQRYRTAVGGRLTHLETIPGLTPASGQVTVAALSGRWAGFARSLGTPTVVTLNQDDVNAAALSAGQEYKALLYASPTGVSSILVAAVKGPKAAAGTATVPTIPSATQDIPLGVATVAFGGTVTVVSTATTTALEANGLRYLGAANGCKWEFEGILIRDADEPNPGARWIDATLPSSDSGVATGDVRVAFGYPLGMELYDVGGGAGAPYAAVSTAGRDDYDMAFVYGPYLAIEYGQYHLNLYGPDIDDPGDCEILSTISPNLATAQDRRANLMQLPNGEIALSRPYSDAWVPNVPQMWQRYRVRPAPTTAPTVALAQIALGVWPNDTNAWTARSTHQVVAWTAGDTSFTLTSGSWTHGKPVACVVWQQGSELHYSQDPTAKTGILNQPTGGVCTVSFGGGGGAQAPKGGGYTPRITVLGPALVAAYAYTFTTGTLLAPVESALSPFSGPTILAPTTDTYTVTVTVPTGPTGTVRRTLYRFAYDREATVTAGIPESPWDARTSQIGGLYDRMFVQLVEIDDNVTTDYVDVGTTLTFSGDRPPLPFMPVGSPVTMDTPTRVYTLAPLNL